MRAAMRWSGWATGKLTSRGDIMMRWLHALLMSGSGSAWGGKLTAGQGGRMDTAIAGAADKRKRVQNFWRRQRHQWTVAQWP